MVSRKRLFNQLHGRELSTVPKENVGNKQQYPSRDGNSRASHCHEINLFLGYLMPEVDFNF